MQRDGWPARLFLIHRVSGYLVPYGPDTLAKMPVCSE